MNEYTMNEEQNVPDELWRRVFDEAAETPPPRVWSAIERQLDEPGNARVLPLWGAMMGRPVVWGTGLAAAVALLLVGSWLIRTEPAEQPSMARVQPAETGQSAETHTAEAAQQPLLAESERATATLGAKKPANVTAIGPAFSIDESRSVAAASTPNPKNRIAGRSFTRSADEPPFRVDGLATTALESGRFGKRGSTPTVSLPTARYAIAAMPMTSNADQTGEPGMAKSMAMERLASRHVRLYETHPIQRIVWVQPADATAPSGEEQVRVASKTRWASASVMPGAFNPGVSVALPAYANAAVSVPLSGQRTGTASTVSSRANVSVAFQAGAGVQLTDRWSVESGVGYLAGRSTVASPAAQPVYSFAQSAYLNAATPIAGNLYVDLLRSQTGKTTGNRPAGVANDLLISNTNPYTNLSSYNDQRTIANNYAYVQVPVQVGYELRPRKRLTLAVLGGLITSIFVKNTVDDALVIKAGDGVYKPVALVASMGARFRYRSSERWSASLAGVYQPSLTAGTRPDSPVQTSPTTTGMTFGVDYHF